MQKATANNSDFMLTGEVARELERSPQRIIQLEREGKLPAQRTAGGTRLFRRADVEKLKTAREQKAS
jgi:excisionase family DNA binding protein